MANWLGNEEVLGSLRRSARNAERVTGLTHRHYKYPARFSPKFVATAIESFSKPGDLVLDPYMGGGTTVLESYVRGRQAVGCDLNALAVFVSRVKSEVLNETEAAEIRLWATEVVPSLSYYDNDDRIPDILCERRTQNLQLPRARPIKKLVALALLAASSLSTSRAQDFARCALLNVGQWALNGKKRAVSLTDFRRRITEKSVEMLASTADLAQLLKSQATTYRPILIHDSSERLKQHEIFTGGRLSDLVVTSPPYPGVHVLYHRWQVDGRRETAAPYWIANCLDGQGASYYNFGARQQESQDDYFEASLKTLQGIRPVMRAGAVIVQLIAFSRPRSQLPRYLKNMKLAGFSELKTYSGRAGRAWRKVPGRSWHAALQGQTKSASEVVLLHVAT